MPQFDCAPALDPIAEFFTLDSTEGMCAPMQQTHEASLARLVSCLTKAGMDAVTHFVRVWSAGRVWGGSRFPQRLGRWSWAPHGASKTCPGSPFQSSFRSAASEAPFEVIRVPQVGLFRPISCFSPEDCLLGGPSSFAENQKPSARKGPKPAPSSGSNNNGKPPLKGFEP